MSATPALILAAIAAYTGTDPYVRSRITPGDSTSHCLWWPGGSAIVYNQSNLGNPNGDSPFAAVTTSWQSWQAIQSTCGSLTLSEGPLISGTPGRTVGYDQGSGDNHNVLMFRQRLCSNAAPSGDPCFSAGTCNNQYDCWSNLSGTIALTTTTYRVSTGQILDADVEFNAASFHFTTLQSGCQCGHFGCSATDVQNTATHEFGHTLGLDHTTYCDGGVCSVMNPNSCPGETSKRTIDPWSSAFVCDVYPKGRASQDCIAGSTTSPETAPKSGCASAPGGFAWPLMALFLLGLAKRRLWRA